MNYDDLKKAEINSLYEEKEIIYENYEHNEENMPFEIQDRIISINKRINDLERALRIRF